MYQQWRLKQMILEVDPKQKKKHPAGWFDLPDTITEEWVKEHQVALATEMREKIEKKFAKDNEKLAAEGKKPMKDSELAERLEKVQELQAKFKKENKTKKVEPEGKSPSVEKLEASITKIDERIKTMSAQAEDRDANKEVALGTSKINYIDPRLSVVFCKKFDVPIEKIFPSTLREKFRWAIDSADETWEF
jgi:DNA topoisomerase-1